MKKHLSHLWRSIEGVNGLLLILYTTFIFSTYFYFITDQDAYFARWTVFVFAMAVICCPLLLRWLRKTDFCRPDSPENNAKELKKERRWKILFFLIPFAVFFLKYIIYFPGAFSTDSVNQYEQAISGNYNDWHPVLQTLLSFKIPLMLTGGWIGSITLFHMIALSLVTGYLLLTVRIYTNRKYAIIALIFIALNPNISNIAMYPWKDTAFAIGAVLLTAFSLRIFFSRGEWLRKPLHTVLFVIVMTVTSIVRHNAPLFTITLAIGVFCLIGLKRSLVLGLSIILLFVGIKGPLYSALHVEPPGERQVEMLGLPMSIIAAVAKYAPEDLDEETKEFVDRVAIPVVWGFYEYGCFYNVRWYGANTQVIEEYGAGRIIPMAFRTLLRSPREALKGLIRLTDAVYTVCDDYLYADIPSPIRVDPRYENSGIPALQDLNAKLTFAMDTLLPWLFMYVGSMHYILLAMMLAKCRLNRREDWKKILFVLPCFAYNFGTMFLLTWSHDSSRFFMYIFMITPALIGLLGSRKHIAGEGKTV